MNAHYRDDAAGKPAIRALEQAARDEPDVEIRGRAIVTLGLMAHHQKLPCPLALLRAMSDKDEEVRSHAGSVVALFTQYAPGAAEVLVKGTQSADPAIRTNYLYVLGPAAGSAPPCNSWLGVLEFSVFAARPLQSLPRIAHV